MHEEYLDLDGELLDMQADNSVDGEDLSVDALGLQADLADQMDLQGSTPKFVSSLDPVTPATAAATESAEGIPAPTEDAHLNNGEGEGQEEEEQEDLISIILRSKGVTDPTKIKMANDEGGIEEVSFDDLDYETQVNLLTSAEEYSAEGIPNLNEDEAELIEYLRQNNLTVEQLLQKQRESVMEEYAQEIGQVDFEEISDEDLYRLELQSTYDLLDEEVDLLISKELEYPELFAKKVNKLRNDYKEAEEQRQDAELQAAEEQRQADFTEFSNGLFETARGVDEIGGLTLSDQDRQEVLESILTPDANGVSQFTKLFNDKESFFKMAWFAIKGKDAFEMLHSHYKNVIEESRKDTVKKNVQPKTTKLTFKGDVKGLKTQTAVKKKDVRNDEFIIDNFVQ